MALGVFSVTGDALNFGGRRMETIMRVAWLPVALLLIVNMATVFAYLSAIAGRLITFADIATFQRAQQLLIAHSDRGWTQAPQAMTLISVANLSAQAILIAAFMAPLIRYAGLGETPRRGVVRLAFGPDQMRFIISGAFSFMFLAFLILAPILLTSFFVMQYVVDALSQTLAHFPDPDSLHTVELTTSGESLAARGEAWIYTLALPATASAPFLLALWALAFLHFHPRNRPSAAGRANPALRAAATLAVLAAIVGAAYWLFGDAGGQPGTATGTGASAAQQKTGDANGVSPMAAAALLGVAALLLTGYFSLRLYAYPGVAVCRKSLALGGVLRVTRGWNIFRLFMILVLIAGFLLIVQFLINNYALTWIRQTLYALYAAADASSRLVNSGDQGAWVQPVFVWIWNGVKIAVNVFWTFFSYGVAAGLYGRLYRESQGALESA